MVVVSIKPRPLSVETQQWPLNSQMAGAIKVISLKTNVDFIIEPVVMGGGRRENLSRVRWCQGVGRRGGGGGGGNGPVTPSSSTGIW